MLTALDRPGKMDEQLTGLCLNTCIGSINRLREEAETLRQAFICNLIWGCIFGEDGGYSPDVGMIQTVIKRIDGSVPEKGKRDGYANIIGEAIEAVLSLKNTGMELALQPTDTTLTALCKVLVAVSMEDVGKSMARRKDRQLATEIILERTGGLRSEPSKEVETIVYVEPAWMQLPEGDGTEKDE